MRCDATRRHATSSPTPPTTAGAVFPPSPPPLSRILRALLASTSVAGYAAADVASSSRRVCSMIMRGLFVCCACGLFFCFPHMLTHTRTYSRHSVSTHLQCQNVGQLFCCFGSSSSRATRTFEDALALPLHLSACICFYPSPFTSIFPSLTPSLSLHHLYLSLSLRLQFCLGVVGTRALRTLLPWPTSGMCHAPSHLHFCSVSFVAQRQLWL